MAAGFKSPLAIWVGGAGLAPVTTTAGVRSMLAPWVGGAGVSPSVTTAGVRNLLAFWAGGAGAAGGTPVVDPGVVPVPGGHFKPYAHVPFSGIKPARHQLIGVHVRARVGRLAPAASVSLPLRGSMATARVRQLRPTAAARVELRGCPAYVRLGGFQTIAAGVSYPVRGVRLAAHTGAPTAQGSASLELVGCRGISRGGAVYPYGVHNLSDEEMAILALKLTGKY